MDLNKPILEHIVKMGSNSLTISDAVRASLQCMAHYEGLSVRRSAIPVHRLQPIWRNYRRWRTSASRAVSRVHYLALVLDPRPSMRAFVQQFGLVGSSAGKTVGNSEMLSKDQSAGGARSDVGGCACERPDCGAYARRLVLGTAHLSQGAQHMQVHCSEQQQRVHLYALFCGKILLCGRGCGRAHRASAPATRAEHPALHRRAAGRAWRR